MYWGSVKELQNNCVCNAEKRAVSEVMKEEYVSMP